MAEFASKHKQDLSALRLAAEAAAKTQVPIPDLSTFAFFYKPKTGISGPFNGRKSSCWGLRSLVELASKHKHELAALREGRSQLSAEPSKTL